MSFQPIARFDYARLTSTQDQARQLIDKKAAPFFVTAESQEAGRGRGGREWFSPKGNYYSSLVLPMPANIADAPQLSFVAALALLDALEALGVDDLALKWPNDVLASGCKIAGILVEAEGGHVIIGVGVNLAHAPDPASLPTRAMPPAIVAGNIATDAFHAAFDEGFQRVYECYQSFGFDGIRARFDERLWVRKDMIFDDGQSTELVQISGLAPDGALIANIAGREKRIYAGDFWPAEG